MQTPYFHVKIHRAKGAKENYFNEGSSLIFKRMEEYHPPSFLMHENGPLYITAMQWLQVSQAEWLIDFRWMR
jgi:hypothetical protein